MRGSCGNICLLWVSWASTRLAGLAALVTVFRWNLWAGLLVLAGVLLNNILTRYSREKNVDSQEVLSHYRADLNTIATEASASELRLHGFQQPILEILKQEQKILADTRHANMRAWVGTEVRLALPSILATIVVMLMLVFALLRNPYDVLGIAALPALSQLHNLGVLFGAIRVTKAHRELYADLAALEAQIVDCEPVISTVKTMVGQPASNSTIVNRQFNARDGEPLVQFQDVTFTYPDNSLPTINQVSLSVKPGEVVALVGENGAGKTTLLSLLLGINRAQLGQVELQAQAVVELVQSPDTLPFSIVENIWPWEGGHPGELSDCSICAAIKLDRFTGSENASKTSGGEKQRIALARCIHAIIRTPGLLVLDEPSSALDVEGEAQVVELLKTLVEQHPQISVLFTSHRFSTVKHAHRIVVLAQGQVSEQGTHPELMASGGKYAAMYTTQAQLFRTAHE